MSRRALIASAALLLSLAGAGVGLASWKQASIEESDAAAASMPPPLESVLRAVAAEREHLRTTTAIGTVVALRSITLRNEVPGTVREVRLESGTIVEEGTVLVALDTSVEEAELRAQEAQARLAETMLGRMERARESRGAADADVDRARAERDRASAEVERIRAIIERRKVRAPFRARVGISDVHPGQYLEAGTLLTTLQGVDDAVHLDFTVAQDVALRLEPGRIVAVQGPAESNPLDARIVAIDARVDPATRNATVRARVEGANGLLSPGASVRVRVPTGEPVDAVVVPVSALRKGPAGDHVFVLESAEDGSVRAHQRLVKSGAALGDEVVIREGLSAGEAVAASGSFKLYDGAQVAIAGDSGTR